MIGGGTGSFNLLSSLKSQPVDITAVVNMVDDGGSTGKLRDELGALPPGDIRQCLVALSDAPGYLRELFNYRFEDDGGLSGHSFGNLFLSALEKINNSFEDSVEFASRILSIRGSVVPVTLDDTKLVMDNQGVITRGQINIELTQFPGTRRPKFALDPVAQLNPKAAKAISEASLVVIAPGNLYSSLIPPLLTAGMKQALESTDADVVMVCNLVNKSSQNDGFKVSDYLDVFEEVIGEGSIDCVIYNNQGPPEGLLEKYATGGSLPVEDDSANLRNRGTKLVGAALISDTPIVRKGKDSLMKAPRNFIRHDADKLAELLMDLVP